MCKCRPAPLPSSAVTLDVPAPGQSAPPAFSQRFDASSPWEPYDSSFASEIAAAIDRTPVGGYVWCPFAGGNTFQLRWGTAATSDRMPTAPATGMVQVNVRTENTRIAQRHGPTDPASPWQLATAMAAVVATSPVVNRARALSAQHQVRRQRSESNSKMVRAHGPVGGRW